MKRLLFAALLLLLPYILPDAALAGPDQFICDTAIYSGGSAYVTPNILFIINNSRNMADLSAGAEPYSRDVVYPGTYKTYGVYFRNNPSSPWQLKVDTIGGTQSGAIKVTCGGTDVTGAKELLLSNGFWQGGLSNTGACSTANNDQKNYYLGNLINKLENAPPIQVWAPNTVYASNAIVRPTSASTVTYRAVQVDAANPVANMTSGATAPVWPTDAGASVVDNTVRWERVSGIFEVTKTVLRQVIGSLREKLNVGILTFGSNNDGAFVRAPVSSVGTGTTASEAHYNRIMALLQAGTQTTSVTGVGSVASLETISSNALEPVSSALFDASVYYRGQSGNNTLRIGSESGGLTSYLSPIQWSCQKNYVIVLTTGASEASANGGNAIGDQDADGRIADPQDAAKLLRTFDHSTTMTDIQGVQTSIIQFLTRADRLVTATTKPYGDGTYVLANSTEDLEAGLRNIVENIVRELDTAFVAPVVPASPENRTFSGKRIYLGFFKPISQQPWQGNLKKFGLNSDNNIVSATIVNGEHPLATTSAGAFLETAQSYWSSAADAGSVTLGGIGGELQERDFSTDPRQIITYLGTDANLTASANEFNATNITATMLGLSATPDVASGNLTSADQPELIDFIRGIDAFDDNGDLSTTDKREWMLGDILHSRPLVMNYANYTFNDTNEANCNMNKTYVFVGANDGMLHAIRDCDGKEVWAFIPPDLLPYLKYQRGLIHNYFVDGSPTFYIHDRDGDGNIETLDDGSGDRVILLFGTYRGGGQNRLLPPVTTDKIAGYYALDVSNPEAPKWLGKLTNLRANYPGLGETWSVPRIAKVKTDSTTQKIVAIIGGGYDNNEDMRWGNTQLFPLGLANHDQLTDDGLPIRVNDFREGSSYRATLATDPPTPPGPLGTAKNLTGDPANPKGRGIYVFELATLTPGVNANGKSIVSPAISDATFGNLVWSFEYGATASNSRSPLMTYSIPSDVALLDTDADGFTDRLYVGDTGGQLWRFDIGYKAPGANPVTAPGRLTTEAWKGQRIFTSNVGTTDVGRKIFHRPDAVSLDSRTTLVYFGTGDRAHPLNYLNPATDGGAVMDRLYMVRDTDAAYDNNPGRPAVINETHLVDLTTNPLQRDDTTTAQLLDYNRQLFNYTYHVENNPTPKYGWYVKLNYDGGSTPIEKNWGEKALATPIVFDEKVFFTTYQPLPYDPTANPCSAGNLGKARFYAMDYRTAEAVYDFYNSTLEDYNSTDAYGENQASATNEKAQNKGSIFRRADRIFDLGGGIPTTPTIIVNEYGELDLVTPADQNFVKIDLGGTNMIRPVYWMQW